MQKEELGHRRNNDLKYVFLLQWIRHKTRPFIPIFNQSYRQQKKGIFFSCYKYDVFTK